MRTQVPQGFWTGLAEAMTSWLPTQRWFAAKDRPIARVDLLPVANLTGDGYEEPTGLLTVARVHLPDAVEDYQVPIGLRRVLPECLAGARITRVGGVAVYDATADPELMSRVLALINSDTEVGGVAFHREARWSTMDLREGLAPRLGGAEQSNTSVVFGERYILKLFRHLTAGVNPDVAVHRALMWSGCAHIARLVGTISARAEGHTVTLGMLQCFAADARDGWELALDRVRAVAHGDPDVADDTRDLGAAVAAVHGDLASQLGADTWGTPDLVRLASRMRAGLNAALRSVPSLAPYRERLTAAFDAVAELPPPIRVQRVHGDLHLGQVLRTPSRWLLLDFEGEPAAPLAQRIARHPALRDVAGMLRSFDYAAAHVRYTAADLLDGDPEACHRVEQWAARQRALFRAGYQEQSGTDLAEYEMLLRAYELEKAVYETVYEARHRPDWLPIPLAALDRLLAPVPAP